MNDDARSRKFLFMLIPFALVGGIFAGFSLILLNIFHPNTAEGSTNTAEVALMTALVIGSVAAIVGSASSEFGAQPHESAEKLDSLTGAWKKLLPFIERK
jgi:hypothetical protein